MLGHEGPSPTPRLKPPSGSSRMRSIKFDGSLRSERQEMPSVARRFVPMTGTKKPSTIICFQGTIEMWSLASA